MQNRNDQEPESRPVRKWRARLAGLLLWLVPRTHDHADTDAQGRRW